MALLLAFGLLAAARLAIVHARESGAEEATKTKLAAVAFAAMLALGWFAAVTPSLFSAAASSYGSAFSGLPRLLVGGPVSGAMLESLRARIDGRGGADNDEGAQYLGDAFAAAEESLAGDKAALTRIGLTLAGVLRPLRPAIFTPLPFVSADAYGGGGERDDHLGFLESMIGGGARDSGDEPFFFADSGSDTGIDSAVGGGSSGTATPGSGTSGTGTGGTGTGGSGGGTSSGSGGGGTPTTNRPDPITVGRPPSVRPSAPPPAGAVPEPASWMMLIVGFGAVGVTLRHARRPMVA